MDSRNSFPRFDLTAELVYLLDYDPPDPFVTPDAVEDHRAAALRELREPFY
jgi:hypothetical protein